MGDEKRPPSMTGLRLGQLLGRRENTMTAGRVALLTVKAAAVYMGRTEKAIRHLYERGTLTPIRIDGRVQIDPDQIDGLITKAKREEL